MYKKLKELNIGGTFKSNLCDFVVIEKKENETVLVGKGTHDGSISELARRYK